MQEIAAVSKAAASLHSHIPRHLLHPLLVRVDGDPGDFHLAALEMDKEQHVVSHQSAQREDLHCEKVGARQNRPRRLRCLKMPSRQIIEAARIRALKSWALAGHGRTLRWSAAGKPPMDTIHCASACTTISSRP